MWRVASLLATGLLAGSCFLEGPPPPRPEHSIDTLPVRVAGPPATTRSAPVRGAPARGAVPAAAPAGNATTWPQTEPEIHVAQPDAGGLYRYNALFEPPRGRIIHGMGQWDAGNAEYVRMLDDPKLAPASELLFAAVGDWPRPWDSRLDNAREALAKDKAEGRFPHLNISLFGIDMATRREKGIDHEIVASDRYDGRIRDLARLLAELRGPAFVRIGGEFSGAGSDYHEYEYPKAYRKIVDIFRQEGADNVAFVWCYEPSGPDDFDVKDSRGWRWFPGDDVIDWYGLDVFNVEDFVEDAGTGRRGSTSRNARGERFLKMARDHGKPVIIGECSAARIAITPDLEDGRRDWAAWFGPFFAWMERHPEILAFHYINYDWRNSSSANTNGWLDARINLNSYLSRKWVEELRKPKYLHAPDIALLNGYEEASRPKPGAAAEGTKALPAEAAGRR